jgi:hypothetical protein
MLGLAVKAAKAVAKDHLDKSKRTGSWLKRARFVLRLSTGLLSKVPEKGDTPLTLVLKGLSAVDELDKLMREETDAVQDLIDKHGLVYKTSKPFVYLFCNTSLREEFTLTRIKVGNGEDSGSYMTHAVHPEYGELYLTPSDIAQEDGIYCTRFLHSPNFNFEKVFEDTWVSHDGKVSMSVMLDRWGGEENILFSSFKTIRNPLYGSVGMEDIIALHRRFATDKVQRTYLFLGKPGVGKSSAAQHMAEALGTKTFKMDAASFSTMSVEDIVFLLESFSPDFLLVDDIDKITLFGLPVFLEVLQRFKLGGIATTLIMTANSTDELDKGIIRPGRIDTIIEFDLPDAKQRRQIFQGYLEENKVSSSLVEIGELVKATDGLSQDYLREIALKLKYDSFENVLKLITLMKKLTKEDSKPAAVKKDE